MFTETYLKSAGGRSVVSRVRPGHENRKILHRPGGSSAPGPMELHGVEVLRPIDRHLRDALRRSRCGGPIGLPPVRRLAEAREGRDCLALMSGMHCLRRASTPISFRE